MRKKRDRALGMDRTITRRDFLNGCAVTVGASLAAGQPCLAGSACLRRMPRPKRIQAITHLPKPECGAATMDPGKWLTKCATARPGRMRLTKRKPTIL